MPYSQSGLTAHDFTKVSGSGPLHPEFTNLGSLLQFGYMTSNSANGGPMTKALGLDNWVVRANLARPRPGTLGVVACVGSEIGNLCPCFTSVLLGNANRGCPHSIEPRGAMLVGIGTASVANDTVILHVDGMPNSFCLYFQGTALVSVPFGDGKLCVGGTIVRLSVKLYICNSSQYPAGSEPSISVQSGIVTPGRSVYQVWYRAAALFCTGSTFNLTNSLAIRWTP
ncbi:MAG: hypothetical protein SGI72_01410 [Planctomycetota bacterium]|nr:hypothetical protein [Planctomycetota bacterium]